MTRRAHTLLVLAAAAALAAATALASAPAGSAAPPRLAKFNSCGQLIEFARDRALSELEAMRVPRAGMPGGQMPVAAPQEGARDGGGAASGGHSNTNVQEAGVDEPDIVKLDDRRMFSVVEGTLRAIDLTGDRPRVTARLAVAGEDHELLLHGERLIVLGQDWDDAETVRMLEVDVSQPSVLRVLRGITVPGSYLSARVNGAVARVVLSTDSPNVYSKEAIRRARWLPRGSFYSRRTGKRSRRALTRCGDVRHPTTYGGLGMLTVLTFDLDRGLVPVDSDAVMADAETVYASTEGLFVATERWVQPGTAASDVPTESSTLVHRFAGGARPVTAYGGSGAVPGYLLNQFSLSEHEGHLRVATTTAPSWMASGPRAEAESMVSVLAPRDGRLAQVGRVDGLGRDERIYAVRFLGDVGFVVTFRETDPLYTLDLRNPRAPRVAGELKIPGYSAYLHPVGDDLLLGVGQDATGRGELLGSQVSLFDVSDPRRPVRVAQRRLGTRSFSPVEEDHRAFLFWPATGLAVMPLTSDSPDDMAQDAEFDGAVGLRVGPGARLAEAGRFAQGEGGPVLRAAVHHGRLLTLSDDGLRVSDLQTLRQDAWVAF
ncbi:MAG TPA: beta-propeller domain-containing protein [Solirubrobacteraceae bacterium]|nr:beta-propeller domain-containing protein [Solirubrobacteraceae bacterium]